MVEEKGSRNKQIQVERNIVIHRQIDTYAVVDKHTFLEIDKQVNGQRKRGKESERESERWRERQIERQRVRVKQRVRDGEIDRQRDRE